MPRIMRISNIIQEHIFNFCFLAYFDPFLPGFGRLVISDGLKMERKSSMKQASDFFKSKITEAKLEEFKLQNNFRT